ncbi:MAG TPA: hypothetical protein VFK09_02495 [Gemmatimonadales bacterium]|nr:hypothetical protein [Gemmatimonadales bacterium]
MPVRPAAGPRQRHSINDPFGYLKLAVAGILLFGTAVALVLALTGVVPAALKLVGICWALYGFVTGLLDGVLDPAIEGLVRALGSVGLIRAGGGYSAVETLVARGHYEAAAEAYAERARAPRDRVEATLRRAALLAGPMGQPEVAAAELEALREGGRALPPADDIRVGLALADLLEGRLSDPGRAMVELRRLLDRYPAGQHLRRIRTELAALKRERFGAAEGAR